MYLLMYICHKYDDDPGYLSHASASTFSAKKLGCTTSLPQSVLKNSADLDSSSNVMADCRLTCARDHLQIAITKQTTCVCASAAQLEDITTADCTASDLYRVYWASHVTTLPSNWLTEIEIEVEKPTSNDYVRPMETLTFVITTTGPERTTLHVDFDDGVTKILPGGERIRVSHMWALPGTYKVNVTAVSRTITESRLKDVQITEVEEGTAPEQVHIKADTRLDLAESGIVDFYLDAFSPKEKSCVARLDPEDVRSYDGITDLVYSNEINKQYPALGMYNVTFQCTNNFGTSSDWSIALSANPAIQFVDHSRPEDVVIPVTGIALSGYQFRIFIDDRDQTSKVSTRGNQVTIGDDVIRRSGEHVVMIKSSGKTLFTELLNAQRVVSDVRILASVVHAEVDHPIEFEFSIGQGDFMHIRLDFGDAGEELLFVAISDGPVTIKRNHSYAELGHHYVTIQVANDVSSMSQRQLISIERPLRTAAMLGANVTTVGEPTPFTFRIDMDLAPAMPVLVTFDYDNGVNETVLLGDQRDTPTELQHWYAYPEYGIYRVKAYIQNNISEIVTNTLVQVGENITTVDVFVDKGKVVVDEPVTFTIQCPRGSPLYIELETGDGEVLQTTRGVPSYGIGTTLEDPYQELERKKREADPALVSLGTLAPSTDATETGRTDGTTPSAQASDPDEIYNEEHRNSEDGQPGKPTLPPNEAVMFTYAYKQAGTYSVKVLVRNKFSRTESYLCPEVVVAQSTQNEPDCSTFDVTIREAAPENDPLVSWRSKEVNIATEAAISCDEDWKLRYEPRYSWKTEWKTKYGSWRPELEVCESEMPESVLTIPGNTLWYGTYKLTVIMTFRSLNTVSRKRRATNETSLEHSTYAAEGEITPTRSVMLDVASSKVYIERIEATQEAPKKKSKKSKRPDPYEEILKLHKLWEAERQQVIMELSNTRATMIRSASKSTYLNIVPSPLVADIEGWLTGEVNNFVVSDVIKANLSVSHDPDVDWGNKTGLTMHFFCYVQSAEQKHANRTLAELIQDSVMLSTNLDRDVFVYDTEDCYGSLNGTAVFGHEVNIIGSDLNMDDDLIFELIVTKDSRVSRTSRRAHVYSAVISVDALDNIDFDNLDVNAALTIVSLVVGVSSLTR